MIKDALAGFFRKINSQIVTTNSAFLRKILKVTLLLSYRLSQVAWDGKNEEVVIRNFDSNILMTINPLRSMGKVIYWTGFHEVKELMFLHRFLTPEMVFLDIGANMGEYTLFAAKRLNCGHVYSFEPWPYMQKALEENIALNSFDNISVMHYGLSDKNGELPIFEVKHKHEGLSTLYPGDREIKAQHAIELKVLDNEFVNLNRLDFVKIDIEGSELLALKGARRSIEKFRPYVMVEINNITYEMAGYTSLDILDFFLSMNYHPFLIDRNAKLRPCTTLPSFGNIIFKPA